MANHLSGHQMRELAAELKSILNPRGLGFCLLVFETGNSSGMANYVSDCEREDMIKFLEETAERLRSKQDFMTPEKT
jgi:hypothetical protein